MKKSFKDGIRSSITYFVFVLNCYKDFYSNSCPPPLHCNDADLFQSSSSSSLSSSSINYIFCICLELLYRFLFEFLSYSSTLQLCLFVSIIIIIIIPDLLPYQREWNLLPATIVHRILITGMPNTFD